MRVSERMFFNARLSRPRGFARDAEYAERKDLQRDSGQDNSCAHKNMLLNKMTVPGSACCYLSSFLLAQFNTKSI